MPWAYPAIESDERLAIPPRGWFLKRILVASALFLATFALVRWIVGWHVDALAQQRIDAAHARGERILMADYQHDFPPDAQNAAILLNKAVAQIGPTGGYDAIKWTYPMTPGDLTKARPFIQQEAATIALVRQARGCTFVDWQIQYTTPALATLLPFLHGQKNLANHLADAALYAHSIGDDAAAVEHVRDLLFVGNAVDHDPGVVQHLVAGGIDQLGYKSLQLCLPALDVQNPAVRQASSHLLAELINEQRPRGGLPAAILGERMEMWDAMAWVRSRPGNLSTNLGVYNAQSSSSQGGWVNRGIFAVLAPVFERDAMTLFDYETAEAEATRQPDYPATWAAMPATPGSPGSNLRFNTFLPRILMASLSKVVVAEYRNRYDRRAAAIALAARLYEAEHGRAPATIAEMVPEFLPRVPLDPMAGRGTPMPYTPATRPTTAPDPQ